MKKIYLFILATFILIVLGCSKKVDNRKVIICGFGTILPKLTYSISETIIHEDPNQYTISGKAIESQEPLIGLSIFISNTRIGTASDLNGAFYFEFQPEKNQSLDSLYVTFQYIGYQSLEVAFKELVNRKILIEVLE